MRKLYTFLIYSAVVINMEDPNLKTKSSYCDYNKLNKESCSEGTWGKDIQSDLDELEKYKDIEKLLPELD